MTLTVGSLFSGIGGLDLGLERSGMQVIWQSEIDPYANKILNKHWPEVINHGDIKNINWGNVVRPNVICGGYPCQPFSTAGKRQGENDPRHLWPYIKNAISRLRPDYAIMENVRGHLSMGGLTVIGDFASIGYDTEWRVVPAASVGAPHRRDRIIIIAYPSNKHKTTIFNSQNMGNTKCEGLERAHRIQKTETKPSGFNSSSTCSRWSAAWDIEPNVGRVANGVPSRVDRLRGLGNAVVPQVAEVIGRLVVAHAKTI